MFQQQGHVQQNATVNDPGKPDHHWYQDEEMMDLLLHYVGDHPKIVCLLPQSTLYWGDNYHLLQERLSQHYKEYRLHAQSGHALNNIVLVPIRLSDSHWVLMCIVYLKAVDGKSMIYYFSPTGEKSPSQLTEILSSDEVLPNAEWKYLEKRVADDDHNSGVWVIEAARGLAENKRLPPQQHDIQRARAEHTRVRRQMVRSKKTWLSNEVLPEGHYTELPHHGSSLDPAVIEGLELIIECYNAYFKKSRDIPQHRRLDLINLQSKLTEGGVTHVELYEYLMKFVDKMVTGLIIDGDQIIGTGHSKLKSHLKGYLVHHQYNRQAMQARDERQKKRGCDLKKEAHALSQRDLNVLHYYQAQIAELQHLNQQQSVALNDYKKEVDAAGQQYQLLSEKHTTLVATQRETIEALRTQVSDTNQKIIQVEEALQNAKKELDELKRDQAKERLQAFAGAPSFFSRWFSSNQ